MKKCNSRIINNLIRIYNWSNSFQACRQLKLHPKKNTNLSFQLLSNFYGISTTRDGSCLYNSISLLLTRSGKVTPTLWVIEAVHIIMNENLWIHFLTARAEQLLTIEGLIFRTTMPKLLHTFQCHMQYRVYCLWKVKILKSYDVALNSHKRSWMNLYLSRIIIFAFSNQQEMMTCFSDTTLCS